MDKTKLYKALATGAAIGAMAMGGVANAAADPEVLSVAGNVATTTQENMLAVIHQNTPIIILVGVLILAITFTWKFLKRFTGR